MKIKDIQSGNVYEISSDLRTLYFHSGVPLQDPNQTAICLDYTPEIGEECDTSQGPAWCTTVGNAGREDVIYVHDCDGVYWLSQVV
jgi:hypothetical protein